MASSKTKIVTSTTARGRGRPPKTKRSFLADDSADGSVAKVPRFDEDGSNDEEVKFSVKREQTGKKILFCFKSLILIVKLCVPQFVPQEMEYSNSEEDSDCDENEVMISNTQADSFKRLLPV